MFDDRINQPLTSEEAKKKRCCVMPMACEGDACQAWLWAQKEFHRPVELWSKKLGRRVTSSHVDDSDWRPMKGAPDTPPEPRGYCGHIKRD